MSAELSDEDRTAILQSIRESVGPDVDATWIEPADERLFLAGKRAGIEAASQWHDDRASELRVAMRTVPMAGSTWTGMYLREGEHVAAARAFRALK